MVGFYLPPRKPKTSETTEVNETTPNESDEQVDQNNNETEEGNKSLENETSENEQVEEDGDENVNENEEENDGDEDEEGWIKPSNLEQMKKLSIIESEQQNIENLQIKVGCMTSDFSMQVSEIQIWN